MYQTEGIVVTTAKNYPPDTLYDIKAAIALGTNPRPQEPSFNDASLVVKSVSRIIRSSTGMTFARSNINLAGEMTHLALEFNRRRPTHGIDLHGRLFATVSIPLAPY